MGGWSRRNGGNCDRQSGRSVVGLRLLSRYRLTLKWKLKIIKGVGYKRPTLRRNIPVSYYRP